MKVIVTDTSAPRSRQSPRFGDWVQDETSVFVKSHTDASHRSVRLHQGYGCRWERQPRTNTGALRRLEALDVTVTLERRHNDVHDPEADEEERGGKTVLQRAAEFALYSGMPPADHQSRDRRKREDAKDGDRECERPRLDAELRPVDRVLHRRYRPRDADSEENVHGVAARHVSDRRVGVLVADGRDLARERIWNTTG